MIIRPYYRSGEFYGFTLWAFNEFAQRYEAVGQPFKLHKHAALALDMARNLTRHDSCVQNTPMSA